MKQKISQTSLFVTGAARFPDLIYFAIRDNGLVSQEVEHSRFIAFYKGELAHMGDRNWTAVDMCVAKKPTEKLVAVGEDGQVFTYVGGKATDEVIEPPPIVLRRIRTVEGLPIACGMKRQVFKRIGEGSWEAFHAPQPASGENAGFEDIGGFYLDEIYAAGWNGEIWRWDGKRWNQQASPTNLILTGVCCTSADDVYICGQNGTLIHGRDRTWEFVELENAAEDLWDVCWFKGRLYLSTMTMVFYLEGGQLLPVQFGEDQPATCHRLTEAGGVLWSVGSSDVFSFDGVAWVRAD